MEHGFGGAGRARRNLSGAAVAAALASLAACGSHADKPGAQAQGGQQNPGSGGIAEAIPLAGGGVGGAIGGASGAGGATDACKAVPAGKLALIDDFEDGDSVAAFEPAREAYWFLIDDQSPGGTIEPSKDFKPSSAGYRGTQSAHIIVKGFAVWGASLVVSLSHKDTLRCPYNAGDFAGLRFVARGSGVIRAQFVMPQVEDKEFGGTCDPAAGQVCYDTHGIYVTLGSEYKIYEIPWADFQQRGWGTQVEFDPNSVMALQFAMEKGALPVDMWLDNVEFWDGKPTPPLAGDGGAGGADAGGANSGGVAGEAGHANGGVSGTAAGLAGSDTGGSE